MVGRRVQPGAEAQPAAADDDNDALQLAANDSPGTRTDDDNDALQLAANDGPGTRTDDDNDGLQLAANDGPGTRPGTRAGTAAARAGRPHLRMREQHAARHGTVAAQDDDTAAGNARPPW